MSSDKPTYYNGTTIYEIVLFLKSIGTDRKALYSGEVSLYSSHDVDAILSSVSNQKLRTLKPYYNPKGDNSRVADLISAVTGKKGARDLNIIKWMPETLIMDGGRESIVMLALLQSMGHALGSGPNLIVILPEDDEFDHVENLFYVYRNRLREFYDRPPAIKVMRTHLANNKDELRAMYPLVEKKTVQDEKKEEGRSA